MPNITKHNLPTLSAIKARCFLFLLMFLVATSSVFAQPKDAAKDEPKTSSFKLSLLGHTKEQSKDKRDVLIVLYHDPTNTGRWIEIQKLVSDKKGEYKLELDLYSHYMVEASKGGFTTKQITFDTDVYEEGNKKHEFEFEIDMVPDDGVKYTGPVANVFFQTKKHEFDYELDYSKEEQDEWERQERERKEKEEQARIAAEKKAEELLLAKDLKADEANTMATKIEEAVKLGMGDKDRTIQKLADIFPTQDTLRQRKAIAMYDQLLIAEREAKGANKAVDYKSLFGVAQKVQAEALKENEAKIAADKEKIRVEKEALQAKQEEILRKQKEAAALEMSSKLNEAQKVEDAKKKAEFESKIDAFNAAITKGAGNKEATIEAIKKTLPKDETYKQEKATALYEEYQRLSQGGQNKANIDYRSLFATAERAELEAKEKEQQARVEKGETDYAEAVAKIETAKAEQEAAAIKKIEDAIKSSNGDKEKLIQAFEKTLPSSDRFKREEAEAMYAQYEKDRGMPGATKLTKEQIIEEFKSSLPASDPNRKANAEKLYEQYVAGKQEIAKNANDRPKAIEAAMKLIPASDPLREEKAKTLVNMFEKESQLAQGGSNYASINYSAIFGAAQRAKEDAMDNARAEKEAIEAEKQKQIADYLDNKRQDLTELEKETEKISVKGKPGTAELKRQNAVRKAFEDGAGDPDATVKALMQTFDDNTQYKEERATAMWEQNEENKKLKKGSSETFSIDYASLFSAAERAELAQLTKQYEEKKAKETVEQTAYNQQVQAAKEAKLAEANQTAQKDLAAAEELLAEAKRNNKTPEELAAAEKEKIRLEAERERTQKEVAELIDRGNVEKRKGNYEEAKKYFSDAYALVPDSPIKENINEMDRLIAQAEKDKEKELAAIADKAERDAARKAEQEKKDELARAEQARKDSLAKVEKEKKDELARVEEEKRLQKIKDDSLALVAKAQEKARIAEQEKELLAQQAELARLEKEAADLRKAQEAETAKENQYKKLMTDGEGALEFKRYEDARKMFAQAAELKPESADAQAKVNEAEQLIKEEKAVAAAADKAEKEKQANQKKYDKLMAEAKVAMENKYLVEAKQLFTEASAILPEMNEPKAKIKEAETLIAADAKLKAQEEAAAKILAEKTEQYNKLTDAGDDLFERKDYKGAKAKYEEAGKILPDGKYHQVRLRDADNILTDIARNDAQYEDYMKQADGALNSKFYEKARGLYVLASKTKPEEKAPQDKVKEIDVTVAKIAEEKRIQEEREAAARKKAMDENYASFMKNGDEFLAKKDYKKAIEWYGNATDTKPNEQAPKDKKAEAERLWAKQIQEENAAALARNEAERIRLMNEVIEKMKTSQLNEQQKREEFLSQVARIYPQGLTEETIKTDEYVLSRYVYNESGKVTMFEKKEWGWGGKFHFKNGDITITEELFNLGVASFKK